MNKLYIVEDKEITYFNKIEGCQTLKQNLNSNDYLMLIREAFEEVISEYKTEESKDTFEKLFLDIAKKC